MNTPKKIEMQVQPCANDKCMKLFIITTPERISGIWAIRCPECGVFNRLDEISKSEDGRQKFVVKGILDNNIS
jgi:hypothetical protein